MSRALERAIEAMAPGTRLEVVDSTYRPELNGTTRTVVGPASKLSRRLFAVLSDHNGQAESFGMELSKTNLEWLDDDTIRYPIGRGDHTVTLRFLRSAEQVR